MLFRSPPSQTTTTAGFDVANCNLRSLLMHPLGVVMASLLNDAVSSYSKLKLPREFKRNLNIKPEELSAYLSYTTSTPPAVRDSILNSAMSKWNTDLERNLTQNIMAEIQSKMDDNSLMGYESIDGNSLIVEAEKKIFPTTGSNGQMDFVVSKKNGSNDNATKRSVVMIVEFGIGHEIWWQKMSQILNYVNILCAPADDNDITFNQPILLTIVTVYNKKKSKCSTINESEDSIVDVDAIKINDTDVDNTEHANIRTQNASDEKLVVRYGVFHCTRRNNGDGGGNKYRIALLWRKDASSVDDASIQFGKDRKSVV